MIEVVGVTAIASITIVGVWVMLRVKEEVSKWGKCTEHKHQEKRLKNVVENIRLMIAFAAEDDLKGSAGVLGCKLVNYDSRRIELEILWDEGFGNIEYKIPMIDFKYEGRDGRHMMYTGTVKGWYAKENNLIGKYDNENLSKDRVYLYEFVMGNMWLLEETVYNGRYKNVYEKYRNIVEPLMVKMLTSGESTKGEDFKKVMDNVHLLIRAVEDEYIKSKRLSNEDVKIKNQFDKQVQSLISKMNQKEG